ncbi:MAG TPA: MFS transporter [Pyrinomonadaceae bacterium]|nr:MFS transporter [Pyrinomonadaceae bacterium]
MGQDNRQEGSIAPTASMRLLRKAVEVKPEEVRALVLGFVYYFFVLSSYYIIRPIRDEIGVAGGVENLPWLFTGTLIAMLIANALFAALVAKFSRRRFIPIAYRFFILNLIIFFVLLTLLPKEHQMWAGRSFYIWTSVFNLFVVSVFWAFMADIFSTDQGKRLFGFISVGGTLGGIVGAAATATLVRKIGAVNLLLISAVLLELSAQCVRLFPNAFEGSRDSIKRERAATAAEEAPIGGGIWSGIAHDLRSPYLLAICAYMMLYAITSTVLYFQQASIASTAFTDRAARTSFLAQIDLLVNFLTILVQAFLTGRLLKWLGVGITLAMLPALSVLGFTAMGAAPTLSILVVFLTLRRAGNFAIARPAREVLFTVVSREDKYKAKSFIDTFIYRAGDQIGAWSFPAMGWLGLSLAGISFIAAPIAGLWLFISLWLGRKQVSMTRDRQLADSTDDKSGAARGLPGLARRTRGPQADLP